MTTPRIYVASLSDHNEGRLHGVWVDAVDADVIEEATKKMLAASECEPAEEWAIHDYEGFGSLEIREYEDFKNVAIAGAFVEEHGAVGAAWLSNQGYGEPREDMEENFQEQYAGEWPSLEAFAENLLEETGELNSIPENLRNYFDFESYGRDLELGGDVYTLKVDGQTHVFWNR